MKATEEQASRYLESHAAWLEATRDYHELMMEAITSNDRIVERTVLEAAAAKLAAAHSAWVDASKPFSGEKG